MPDLARQRAFVDTNIWLYAFIEAQGTSQHRAAEALLRSCDPVVSTQIINEVCVNLLKKAAFREADLEQLIQAFYEQYEVVEPNRETLLKASSLRQRYSLSFWDSIVVASALSAGVQILYSEDMQDGLLIEEQLRVTNPVTP